MLPIVPALTVVAIAVPVSVELAPLNAAPALPIVPAFNVAVINDVVAFTVAVVVVAPIYKFPDMLPSPYTWNVPVLAVRPPPTVLALATITAPDLVVPNIVPVNTLAVSLPFAYQVKYPSELVRPKKAC